jgi:hypothetical protein
MNLLDNVRTCDSQKVVVAFEWNSVVSKSVTAEVRFGEVKGLYHCAHSSVKQQDALSEEGLKLINFHRLEYHIR